MDFRGWKATPFENQGKCGFLHESGFPEKMASTPRKGSAINAFRLRMPLFGAETLGKSICPLEPRR